MSSQSDGFLSTIKAYGKNLLGFIRKRVGSQEDAEDILQEVWYQLSRIVDLDEIDNINAWLHRVARNKITDSYRKQSTSPEQSSSEEIASLLISEDLPDDDLFSELFWEELFSALEELPEAQRVAFVQNEIEGRTLQDIADAEGEKLKTIISRKRYAVQFLRTRLQALYDDLMNY